MEQITKVSISGFRSIRECRNLELRPLNVLIGSNGAGKSNLLEFFRFLKHLKLDAVQEYVPGNGGADSLLHFGPKITPQLDFEIQLDGTSGSIAYGATMPFAMVDRLIFAKSELRFPGQAGTSVRNVLDPAVGNLESGLSAASRGGDTAAARIHRFLGSIRHHHFNDTSRESRIRGRSDRRADTTTLLPNAANLPNLLFAIRHESPATYERIVDTIRIVAPFFRDFILDDDSPETDSLLLRWRASGQAEYVMGPHQLSDGTLRFIALVTLLLRPPPRTPSLLLLDEPEIGLHPAATNVLHALLKEASTRSQIILATQSMAFLDLFDADDVIVAGLERSASVFKRLNPEDLQIWTEDYGLGDLVRKNFIEAGPNYALRGENEPEDSPLEVSPFR